MALGGVRLSFVHKKGVNGVDARGLPQLLTDLALAENAGDLCEGAQVIGRGIGRGQERKEQVYGLIVQRVECDRRLQADEHAAHAVEAFDTRVWGGDASTNACRAKLFAFQKTIQDRRGLKFQGATSDLGDDRESLPLIGGAYARRDSRTVKQISEFHTPRACH